MMSRASTLERQMLDLINAERTSRGLDPVRLELRLNDSAEDHSDWMLRTDQFSHTGAGSSSAGDRMADAGFDFAGNWTWAENIALQSVRGAPGLADDVVDLHTNLMNSPGHRANILNPDVTVIGIGIEQGNYNGFDAVVVTQNFADTAAIVQIDNAGGTGNTGGGNSGSGSTGGGSGTAAPPSGGPTSGADMLQLEIPGTVSGKGGNDRITGSAGPDGLFGGGGDDVISGRKGGDILRGGMGADTLYGNAGNDRVIGGMGNDQLQGGGGNDRMVGGAGNDRIYGGRGNDDMSGNSGNDVFVFSSGRDVLRDFNARSSAEDIDLAGARGIDTFNDLRNNHMSEQGNHVLIEDAAGNSLLLRNVEMDDLDAGDFLF